jgi:signal peptide peptidase SppA
MKKERRKFREEGRGPLALDPKALDLFFNAADEPTPEEDDGIAVVRIYGPLEHHASWWWASYDDVVACVKDALEDEDTRALVLRIDSPGGDAAGMIETSRKIRALGKAHKKPIYAYADECAASAAYGLACAASEIWLPASGCVGSVGVIAEVVDATERYAKEGLDVRLITTGSRKGDGHPAKPLTDDVESALQAQVDGLGALFFELVAESRETTSEAVASLEAGVFLGKDAVDVGLADGVASWDDFIKTVRAATSLAQEGSFGSTVPNGAALGGTTTEQSMSGLLKAMKAVDDAKKVLLAAKSEKDRAKALDAYTAALEAATKYKKKTVEESEESDEAAEDEDAEESAEADAESSDDDDGEEDKSSTAGSEGTEAEEKAQAILSGKTGLYTYARLYRLCAETARKITGKKTLSVQAVFGAIDGVGANAKEDRKLAARLAKLEDARREDKVTAMLATAKREGKITPAESKALANQDPKWLKGYLATKAKTVRTVDDGEIPPNVSPDASAGGVLVGRSAAAIDIIKRTAAKTGKTVEEIAAQLDADMKKSNGASAVTRY